MSSAVKCVYVLASQMKSRLRGTSSIPTYPCARFTSGDQAQESFAERFQTSWEG